MDEDAMMMVGVSLFLESYCDDLIDLMELVESDIEDHVIRIREYTRILKLLETATDIAAIRRRILDAEFDLRYSMVFYNVICERIVFTTK
jgi:hypothetical protein